METLRMSRLERKRLEVFGRVKREELALRAAAELLGLSYRQTRRVYRRYREEGDGGLVHRLRGRASNRRGDPDRRARVLAWYQEKYADFGPTLAAEYLEREHQHRVGVETLRRWLLAAGLWQAKTKRTKHRRWRPRKEHVGEMVQMDGSHHDWFEGRRDKAVLMVMIDDATNRVYARFFEEETTAAAMKTFWRYVEKYGLPGSLYVDRDSIYETTRDATADEELRETGPLTQFGRAMRELDVRLILAHSPQAKGRVERQNGVLQDRLVKALRLAQISDLEAANRYLEERFLGDLNERFVVPAQQKADLHRSVPKTVKLEQVLSFQESRVVQNDWTVSWRGRYLQLTAANQTLALARKRVTVCEPLDGPVRLLYEGRELTWKELPERPTAAAKRSGPIGAISYTKPKADHPWNRDQVCPGTRPRRPPCSAPDSIKIPARPARSKAGGKKEKVTQS